MKHCIIDYTQIKRFYFKPNEPKGAQLADKVFESNNDRMELSVYTIGHGRHPFAVFLDLLRQHEIEFLCDVRSVARSRWPQFNGLVLHELLNENGIGYEHLPETGGRINPPAEDRSRGVDRIIEIASDVRTVIMCSESKPLTDHKIPRANCHRVGMLAPMLRARGVSRILHILPNGEMIEFDESAVPSLW